MSDTGKGGRDDGRDVWKLRARVAIYMDADAFIAARKALEDVDEDSPLADLAMACDAAHNNTSNYEPSEVRVDDKPLMTLDARIDAAERAK